MKIKTKRLLLTSFLTLLCTSCTNDYENENITGKEVPVLNTVNVSGNIAIANKLSVSTNEVVSSNNAVEEIVEEEIDEDSLEHNTVEIPIVVSNKKTEIINNINGKYEVIGYFLPGRNLELTNGYDGYYEVNYYGKRAYVAKKDTYQSKKRIANTDIITKGCVHGETPIYDNYELKDEYATLNDLEFVEIYKELDNCYLVQTIDCVGFIPKDNVQIINETMVVFDISNQEARLYEGNEETLRCQYTSGKPGSADESDIGLFKIHTKARNLYIVPGAWVDCVAYYNGGEGLHPAEWEPFEHFGSDDEWSHGCARMLTGAALYTYEVVDIGTPVLVKK